MAYDAETLLSDIQTVLSDNLNTKITAINTEKNDTITLGSVASGAYFMDMDDHAANFDPIVLYSVADVESEGIGPATKKVYTVNVCLILNDNGQDMNIVKRMLRYGRCLEEVIENNFYQKRAWDDFKIESLPVLGFQKSGTSLRYKIVGLNIISSIA